MTDSLWAPGLAVLLTGLVVGIWAARRLAGGMRRDGADSRTRDLELAIVDLEARREQIYRRLRGDSEESLTEADRRELELSAARTLKELEEKQALLHPKSEGGKKKRRPRKEKATAEPERRDPSPVPAAGGFAARHPLIAGFLLGGGMVAVVSVLIYWAIRDATPDPAGAMAAPTRTAPAPRAPVGEEPHEGTGDLPITLAVELKALDERVAADGGDLMARRERALFNLGIERYVEAFEDAEALVAADPRDIDGLYVQGVVRLTMGQDDQALELFDQVLQLFPDHMQAMTWRGILLFRNGDSAAAIATWERALELAGGSQADIESLLRMAREEGGGEGSGTAGAVAPGPARSAPPAAAPPAPRPASPAPGVAAGSFGIRLTIADGAFPPPGGVLFLSLHAARGGPPVAVKRIDRVTGFPLDVVIDAADSMMGQELPSAGRVRARLDADGSASTRSEEDLEAEVEARQGESVSLVLG